MLTNKKHFKQWVFTSEGQPSIFHINGSKPGVCDPPQQALLEGIHNFLHAYVTKIIFVNIKFTTQKIIVYIAYTIKQEENN